MQRNGDDEQQVTINKDKKALFYSRFQVSSQVLVDVGHYTKFSCIYTTLDILIPRF